MCEAIVIPRLTLHFVLLTFHCCSCGERGAIVVCILSFDLCFAADSVEIISDQLSWLEDITRRLSCEEITNRLIVLLSTSYIIDLIGK